MEFWQIVPRDRVQLSNIIDTLITELGRVKCQSADWITLGSIHSNNDESKSQPRSQGQTWKFLQKPHPIFISSSFSFPKAYKSFIRAKTPCCRRCQNLTRDRFEYFQGF